MIQHENFCHIAAQQRKWHQSTVRATKTVMLRFAELNWMMMSISKSHMFLLTTSIEGILCRRHYLKAFIYLKDVYNHACLTHFVLPSNSLVVLIGD